MKYYFPSCNYTRLYPQSSKKIVQYLKDVHHIESIGCCKVGYTKVNKEDLLITVCQACDESLSQLVPENKLIRLYEILLNDPDFKWKDFKGMKVNVQDCYRDKDHIVIQRQVRELLKRMNIEVVDGNIQDNYCGTLHYKGKKISKEPMEYQLQCMQEKANEYSCELVVGYCNRCLMGLKMVNVHCIHILDLIFG